MTNLTEFQARVLKDINLNDLNYAGWLNKDIYIYLIGKTLWLSPTQCYETGYASGSTTPIHENEARKLLFYYLKFKNFL